jgi:hypothetical protein
MLHLSVATHLSHQQVLRAQQAVVCTTQQLLRPAHTPEGIASVCGRLVSVMKGDGSGYHAGGAYGDLVAGSLL